LNTYYDVLEVDVAATPEEIKQAFRARAKEFHPDVAKEDSIEQMRLLLDAYSTLSDPDQRELYDKTHFIVPERYRFDYRSYLKGRSDDLGSQSKLIFFDLLHSHEADAVELYDRLKLRADFRLDEYLDREDFMDCAFLLAEEYEEQGQLRRSFSLLLEIARREWEKPYFRHFFEEVKDRLRTISCFKMPQRIGAEDSIRYLRDLVAFGFSRKDTAFFLKKIAELLADMNRTEEARRTLSEAIAHDEKLPGIKKLRDRLGRTVLASPS
jgi:curved DNA-binding protein CbpA